MQPSDSRRPCLDTYDRIDIDWYRAAAVCLRSDRRGVGQSLYALDSTTIDLCLSLFRWAKFRKHKAAVKMHTLLDLHGNIPTSIRA